LIQDRSKFVSPIGSVMSNTNVPGRAADALEDYESSPMRFGFGNESLAVESGRTSGDHIDSRVLEVHVFGAAKGESIVFRTPAGEWGVVDCFTPDLNDPGSNSVLSYLKSRDVKRLAFLCLTHCHDDHFYGMSQLLSHFEVGIFCKPAVLSGRNLRRIIKNEFIVMDMSGRNEIRRSAIELHNIFRSIAIQKKRPRDPLIEKEAVLGTVVFPHPQKEVSEFEIRAVAPSTENKAAFERGLRKCFVEDKLVDLFPSEDHNLSSLALLIRFGKTQMILGGDVETAGWRHALRDFEPGLLSANLVKVPHHGSPTGHCPELWTTFATGDKPISVITAYRRHSLPCHDMLCHIRDHSDYVYSPSTSVFEKPRKPLPKGMRLLRGKSAPFVGSVKRQRIAPFTGLMRIGFKFDSNGRCIAYDPGDDGGQITQGFRKRRRRRKR
jgi:hypothetical protein